MVLKNYHAFYYMLLLCCCASVNEAKAETLRVVFTKVVCSVSDHKLVTDLTCSLLPENDPSPRLNLNLKLTEDFSNITLLCEFNCKQNGRYVNWYTFAIDFCKTMSDAHENYILNHVLKEIRRTSNAPSACPFKKNVDYYVRNYSNIQTMPAYFPKVEWFIRLEFRAAGKGALYVGTYGRVESV